MVSRVVATATSARKRTKKQRKVTAMAEYHVGCGAFGIYAGTLNSRNKNLWQNKTNVTHEAVCAVAQYLLQEDKGMEFCYEGKKYRLCVLAELPKEGDSE